MAQLLHGLSILLARPMLLRERRLEHSVRPDRFERTTLGFEVRCSIQLSYGRMMLRPRQATRQGFYSAGLRMSSTLFIKDSIRLPSVPTRERCGAR